MGNIWENFVENGWKTNSVELTSFIELTKVNKNEAYAIN